MVYRVCVAYLLRTVGGRTEVLLGRKKRGLGTGRYVGLGGKLEAGESALDAIVREIAEEAGVGGPRTGAAWAAGVYLLSYFLSPLRCGYGASAGACLEEVEEEAEG